MKTLKQTTYSQKKAEVKRAWVLKDAENQVLGKLAVEIATILMGKNKPTYTAHIEAGDYVVVTNAAKVAITGQKAEKKTYNSHSGYPGGFKSLTLNELMKRKPTEVVRLAVVNMLPKNKLRDVRMARLKIFAGTEHPYANELSKEIK
jgi:large subunit ribosomal protein L13